MHSIDYNIVLLKEMMDEFEAFILSQELFWPLQIKSFGRNIFPQLSLGSLLMTLDELAVQQSAMNSRQEMEYQNLLREYEKFLRERRTAIENKAKRELSTRTNLWRAYLRDVEEDPDFLEEYTHQVRNRVLMSKLKKLSSPVQTTNETNDFHALDESVLNNVFPGGFIWDKMLESIYPIEEFPFLYMKPQ